MLMKFCYIDNFYTINIIISALYLAFHYMLQTIVLTKEVIDNFFYEIQS